MQATAVLVCCLLTSGAGAADSPAPQNIHQPACLVSILDEANVPAEHPGTIVSLIEREGAQVAKDGPIAQIRDDEAKLAAAVANFEFELAKSEAENTTRIEAAVKSAEVSRTELEIRIKSNSSVLEIERARLSAEHADLQVQLSERETANAKLTQQMRHTQLQLAENQLKSLRVVSPLDGVVAEVHRRQGEWVQQGEPIVRVVRMDRLKVETFVNTSDCPPHELKGATATVWVQLARGRKLEVANCALTFVSTEIEPNGDVRIWVEMENQRATNSLGKSDWIVHPGMIAEMTIKLGE